MSNDKKTNDKKSNKFKGKLTAEFDYGNKFGGGANWGGFNAEASHSNNDKRKYEYEVETNNMKEFHEFMRKSNENLSQMRDDDEKRDREKREARIRASQNKGVTKEGVNMTGVINWPHTIDDIP